jgi:hypothetical protein
MIKYFCLIYFIVNISHSGQTWSQPHLGQCQQIETLQVLGFSSKSIRISNTRGKGCDN